MDHDAFEMSLPKCATRTGRADASAGTTKVSVRVLLSSSIRVETAKTTHRPLGEIAGEPTACSR